MLIHLLKFPTPQWGWKWEKWPGIRIRDQKLISFPIGRPNHNTKYQWNRLIAFAIILDTDRHREWLNDNYKLLPNSVWMWVAKYPVETAISEIHCCVVTLCLTCFCLMRLVIVVLVKFSFICYHELWWIKMNI